MGAIGIEHKTVGNLKILKILPREELLSQLMSDPTRGEDYTRPACLQTEMGRWEMWWLEAVWGTVVMKLKNFQHLVKQEGGSIKLLHWTSAGQTLAYSQDGFRELLVKQPLKIKESRKVGHASKQKSCSNRLSLCAKR